MTETIRQKVHFKAHPKKIYKMLMNSKMHSAFTGDKAVISKEVTGKISAYSGWIEGENIKLIEGKKIVQKWRGADWPKGIYSTVTFNLKKAKDGGTDLEFTHVGVPEKYVADITDGWKTQYWTKIKKYLG